VRQGVRVLARQEAVVAVVRQGVRVVRQGVRVLARQEAVVAAVQECHGHGQVVHLAAAAEGAALYYLLYTRNMISNRGNDAFACEKPFATPFPKIPGKLK
jgi:hypothetical protein